ncbi:MAG: hypothetical protein SFX73_29845 [Kofleriaceae bacterium]|nr:hypothetical protein [Kofleriaceae bacterium]
MAYRQDSADALEAPTADGMLRAELTPLSVKLSVAQRTIQIGERVATVTDHHKKQKDKDRHFSSKIPGRLVVARDVPHEDFGIWLEVDPGTPANVGMRRIFGVEPASLMAPDGLAALAALDRLVLRVKHELADLAGDIRRAFEVGRGLDKVLLADHGDRFDIYARRLFRDRARLAMSIRDDGRIVIPDGKTSQEITVRSRFGVTLWGDYIRFADPEGNDLARVSIPWIATEDRIELARRIGQLVDHERIVTPVWPPTS